MSIINETLSRLEAESPVPAGGRDGIGPRPPIRGSLGLPVKALAATLLVVFAGTSLMVWHWNGQPGGYTGLSVAEAGSPAGPGGTSEPLVSPEVASAQTPPKRESPLQAAETATPTDTSVAASPPARARSETDSGPAQASAKPAQAQPVERHTAGLDPEAAPVAAPERKSSSASPAAARPQRTASAGPGDDRSRKAGTEATERQRPGVAIAEQTSESLVQKGEPAAGAHAAAGSPVRRPAGTDPAGGEALARTDGGSTRGGSDEMLAAVQTKPDAARASSGKPRSAPAPSAKRQPAAQPSRSGVAAKPSAVDEAVERARLALAREQHAQALAALETLSPVPERRADFWLMKGSAHLGLGQLDAAEKAFAAAQPLAPGNAQIAVQRAILKQEKGDHATALQILEEAAERHSSVPEVFLNLGYSQQELGAFGDARRSFRIFLKTTEGRSLYAQQRRAVNQWLAQFSSISH